MFNEIEGGVANRVPVRGGEVETALFYLEIRYFVRILGLDAYHRGR